MRAKNLPKKTPYKYYNVKEAKCIIWYPTAASWLLTKEVSVHHFTLKRRVLCIKALSKHTLYWLPLILIACDTKCHFPSEATLLLIWCDLVDGARHGAVTYLSSGIIADYRCHTARMNMNCFAFVPDLQTSHMKAMSVPITGLPRSGLLHTALIQTYKWQHRREGPSSLQGRLSVVEVKRLITVVPVCHTTSNPNTISPPRETYCFNVDNEWFTLSRACQRTGSVWLLSWHSSDNHWLGQDVLGERPPSGRNRSEWQWETEKGEKGETGRERERRRGRLCTPQWTAAFNPP